MTFAPRASTPFRAHFPQQVIEAGPLQVITANDGLFNHVDDGLPMWTGAGKRTVRAAILFDKPFQAKPAVTLGVTGIDSAHDQNLRFWLTAADITLAGFVIVFTTWSDTHIARAAVSWQAVGARRTEAERAARHAEIAALDFSR